MLDYIRVFGIGSFKGLGVSGAAQAGSIAWNSGTAQQAQQLFRMTLGIAGVACLADEVLRSVMRLLLTTTHR